MPDTTFEPFLVPGATVTFVADRRPGPRRPSAGSRPADPIFDAGGRAGVPDVLVAAARERAQAQGYAAGLAEGRMAAAAAAESDLAAATQARQVAVEEARAELAAVIDGLRSAAAAWERRRDTTAVELVEQVADGIGELLAAVLGHALAGGDDTALDALHRALYPLPGTGPVVVALAPDDARMLHGAAHLLEATTTVDGREVTVVGDPALARGDAVATSGSSSVEVRLADAVSRALAALSS